MNVPQRSKCPANHLVGKPMRPITFNYPRAKFLSHTEVHGLEREFITQFQQPSRLSTHHAFLRMRCGHEMGFNIASEIEI
jgi:hypothetical protein